MLQVKNVDVEENQKSTGLIFISVIFREYWCPFQWYQVTPSWSGEAPPSRYMPFRFEWRQVLYHQAPWYSTAQSLLWAASLSWSRVENDSPRWTERESPAVPRTKKKSEMNNRLYNSYKNKYTSPAANIPSARWIWNRKEQSHLLLFLYGSKSFM